MSAAIGNHLKQAAARVRIFEVFFQMRGELVYFFRQKRNLDLRRAGVLVVYGRFFNRGRLFPLGKHGVYGSTTQQFAQDPRACSNSIVVKLCDPPSLSLPAGRQGFGQASTW